jgi:glycosyltransferase involved in cell wall biosynthesis
MEAMPMTLLEAAALKVPIICSDIDACKTIFENHEVLFFKSGDVDDLANKIHWALGHKEEMLKRSNNAYAKVKNTYSWDKIVLEYDKLYKAMCL